MITEHTTDWIKDLREQFPAAAKTAFFDIAYENCGSTFFHQAMNTFCSDKADIYPGMIKAGGAGKGGMIPVIAETRELIASFIGCESSRNISYTKNTNEGINMLLHGFPFKPGDNIVTSDIEHASVLAPCLNMKGFGVDCHLVHSKDGVCVSADELLCASDEHTRIIVVSYVQSRGGYRLDMRRLTDECHKRGIFVVVDGIQALGFIPLSVTALGIDALSSSCYKGLLAAEGIGFLYCRDSLLGLVRPVFSADNAVTKIDRETGTIAITDPLDGRKLENGTINFSGIYGLNAGLKKLFEIGVDRIWEHISCCFDTIYQALSQMGYSFLTDAQVERRCHSILVRTDNSRHAVDFLMEHGVYLSLGYNGCVRISISPFTTEEDIKNLLSAFALLKAEK